MQRRQIESGFGSESQCFANGQQIHRRHNLVAEFCRLAVARFAKVRDAFAHRFQHGTGTLQSFSFTADHDCQRAFDGSFFTAGNRSIQPQTTFCFGFFSQFARHFRRNCAHINNDRTGFGCGENTLFTSTNGYNIGRIRNHCDDDFACCSDFGSSRGLNP